MTIQRCICVLIIYVLAISMAHALPVANSKDTKKIGAILPPTRQAIPPSLQSVNLIRDAPAKSSPRNGALVCGQNALCASFDAVQSLVSAWMGFPYEEEGVSGNIIEFFIATHGQEAFHLGAGEYATPLWNRRHFWVQTRSDGVPLALQPRYVGIDADTGHELYVVEYVGYRLPFTDYSAYELGMSISTLIIRFDAATETFVDFHIEYYDENDQYTGDYALEEGDEFVSFMLGFEQTEPDVVYLFYMEDIAPVDMTPVFTYREQYPGVDFPCTHCPPTLNTARLDFHYMFEAYTEERFGYTDPLPIASVTLIHADGFEAGSTR